MWNGIRSESEFKPSGLDDPLWCKNIMCKIKKNAKINGSKKWIAKNRLRVALSTANPPHIHSTNIFPIYGIAENKFVITVAPQNLICPQGSTYPMKAVAIVNTNKIIPIFHVSDNTYEP